MADWETEAWEELKRYECTKDARLRELSEALEETREQMTEIRSLTLDVNRVQNGKTREELLDELLDRAKRLEKEMWAEQLHIKIIFSGLAQLSETERIVLETFASMRPERAVLQLAGSTAFERTALYRIKDAALRKYTISIFGIIEF